MSGIPTGSPAAPAQPLLAEGARKELSLWARLLRSEAWVVAMCVLYALAIAPFAPELASAENLANIASNALPLLAVAVGQTIVLITGGIDLSVTSIIALSSVGGAWLMTNGVPMPIGVLAMLGIGGAVGLGNGLAITRLAMPPFMVTLTTMMLGSGVAVYATKSKSIYGLPPSFTALQETIWALSIVGTLVLVVHFILRRSVPGRWLYAVGMSAKAARVSGLPVERTVLLAYVASGVCAGIAAVLYTARLETGSPVLGQRIFLDVIGAAVVGGTSLFGGRGTVIGTACGVLFITVIDNSFNLLGLSSFVVLIAKGAVILLASVLDVVRIRLSR